MSWADCTRRRLSKYFIKEMLGWEPWWIRRLFYRTFSSRVWTKLFASFSIAPFCLAFHKLDDYCIDINDTTCQQPRETEGGWMRKNLESNRKRDFLFPHFLAIVDVAKGSSSRLRLDNDIDQQVKGRPLTINCCSRPCSTFCSIDWVADNLPNFPLAARKIS